MRELLERCDSREIAEWMAYDSVEPFGEDRADLRAGIIASQIVNVHLSKGQRATVPADFMPDFDPKPKPAQSQREMAAVMGQLMAKQNAYVAKVGG